jgi:galactose mutarotase-like enzyme
METIRSRDIVVQTKAAGAELMSIKTGNGTEYLWQGDPAFWARRSPLLFPIVGALPGGTYSYGGTSYRLGNHGFAREQELAVVEQSPEAVTYELGSSDKTLAIYPFRFVLRIGYRASGNRLQVEYTVRNAEERKTLPFSIGAHPGFRAPIAAGETRADFDLVFEKKERVRRHLLNADNVRTGESAPFLDNQDRVAVTGDLFEKGAIVLMDHVSRELTLRSRVSGRYVTVRFPGFPCLGIWSPKGEVPFVCLEPWHGVMPLAGSTQEIEKKEGARILAPGAEFRSAFEIEVG